MSAIRGWVWCVGEPRSGVSSSGELSSAEEETSSEAIGTVMGVCL